MLTYNWRLTQHDRFPDVGAHKLCRNSEALVRWEDEAAVKDGPAKWKSMVKPNDAADLPMPERLDQLVLTVYSETGELLKRLENITGPDHCPEKKWGE